ncbi:MAG: heat-inducible transcription repressor HrcA [Clostridia bacterium]|nr:heat-inducible transcription repressor HrcA [Clostridia bacterium]
MKLTDGSLSERKKLILRAIVDAHVENGEPVGSKYLTQNGLITCSSATIRNEMAELEAMGYLEQPHTSAGRVPSEAGYRFYVDSLVEKYRITSNEVETLREALRVKQAQLDSILDSAMRLAAKMTNYTALAVRPRISSMTVKKYELIQIDPRQLVLVMVTAGGAVRTQNLVCEAPVVEEAVRKLAALLNMRLTGITGDQISLPVMMEMESVMGEYSFLVSPVVKCICQTISTAQGGELKVEGMNKLLSYPEFYDIGKLRDMLAMFERKDELVGLISGATAPMMPSGQTDDGVQVYIGSENPVIIMDSSSLVFKPVKQGDKTVGAIGVIGPTRMNYKKVISMVDGIAGSVSELLSEPEHKD